jgi:hypothetical protein
MLQLKATSYLNATLDQEASWPHAGITVKRTCSINDMYAKSTFVCTS